MDDHPIPARRLLWLAITAGVLGDLLLRTTPWGVNFTLWGAVLLGSIAVASRAARSSLPTESWVVTVLAGACLAFVSLRDSESLTAWNILSVLLAAVLLATRMPSLRRLTIVGMLWELLLHAAYSIAGMAMLLGEDHTVAPHTRRHFPWGAAARGALLAFPPLMFFGALLTSADARFEYFVKEVLNIDLWNIVTHLLLITIFSWSVGGFLRGRFIGREVPLPHGVRLGGSKIGPVETAILLGSVNLLFISFVAVQFSYFFGGDALVIGTPGLTYATYARRGFFELVALLCIALPMLLGIDWIVRKDRIPNVLLFRTLAGGMVALLLVILASAIQRLWLYAAAYGLTEARVHAAAVLAWLAFMLPWFGVTVLRGHRDRFLFGGIVAGYAVLLALNVLNPDALVARVNLSRAAEGKDFDVRHTLQLSADAVPAVIESLPRLHPEDARLIAETYRTRFQDGLTGNWRTWNISRIHAAGSVRACPGGQPSDPLPPEP